MFTRWTWKHQVNAPSKNIRSHSRVRLLTTVLSTFGDGSERDVERVLQTFREVLLKNIWNSG